jgi:hypothetical protein
LDRFATAFWTRDQDLLEANGRASALEKNGKNLKTLFIFHRHTQFNQQIRPSPDENIAADVVYFRFSQ